MEKRQTILGVEFDDVDINKAYDKFISFIKGDSLKMIFTPNPEFLINARKDEEFKNILNSGDLVIPDGIGVLICSKILGRSLKKRVSGYDLVLSIFKRSEENPLSIFILGSNEINCSKAAENIQRDYRKVNVSGFVNGYYKIHDEHDIVKRINSLQPDLLLVALGSPRQEKLIYTYRNELADVKCAIGVGGAIDIFSGNTKLTPAFIRKIGLEWFYRTVSEPKRIKRIIKLPLVLIYAIVDRFGDK